MHIPATSACVRAPRRGSQGELTARGEGPTCFCLRIGGRDCPNLSAFSASETLRVYLGAQANDASGPSGEQVAILKLLESDTGFALRIAWRWDARIGLALGRDAATTAAEEAHVHVLAAANLELGAVRALANFHKLGIATASLRCRGGV